MLFKQTRGNNSTPGVKQSHQGILLCTAGQFVCTPGALLHGKVLICPSWEMQFQKNSHQWVLITARQAQTCHFKLEKQQVCIWENSPVLSCTGIFMDEHSTHTHAHTPLSMKLCCMLYPGNSVCFNTKNLTTISTNGRTACPSKGAMSSSQQLGNTRFPTQPLPDSPSASRASQQQLHTAQGCCLAGQR